MFSAFPFKLTFYCSGVQKVIMRSTKNVFTNVKLGKNQLKDGNILYEQLKGLWLSLKILGLLPYQVKRNGEIKIPWFSFESLYAVTVYIGLTYPSYLTQLTILAGFLSNDGFEDLTTIIVLLTLACVSFVYPVTHWVEIKKVERVFKKWKDFQIRYRAITGLRLPIKIFNKTYQHAKYGLVLIFCLACLLGMVYLAPFPIHWIHLVVLEYVVATFPLHYFLLFDNIKLVLNIVQEYKKSLRKVINLRQTHKLASYNSLWIDLAGISQFTGTIFYRFYAIMLLSVFTSVTMNSFSLIKFADGFELRRLCSSLSAIMSLFIFFSVILGGGKLSHELGSNLITELTQHKIEADDSELEEELSIFIDCIHSVPYEVTINGYVNINLPLLVSATSTMITYMVVMLQFSFSK